MDEHEPWVGGEYQNGLCGFRVALVGWSHWGDEDDEDFGTRVCIEKVISREWRIRFFTQIRNYCGYSDHALFWPKVMFLNYLPNLVGGAEERFGHGTEEQREAAKLRFRRLVEAHAPQKVLVFTSRRWALPEMAWRRELDPPFSKFLKCGFETARGAVDVYCLRHPQGAKGEVMRQVVDHVLRAPLSIREL